MHAASDVVCYILTKPLYSIAICQAMAAVIFDIVNQFCDRYLNGFDFWKFRFC